MTPSPAVPLSREQETVKLLRRVYNHLHQLEPYCSGHHAVSKQTIALADEVDALADSLAAFSLTDSGEPKPTHEHLVCPECGEQLDGVTHEVEECANMRDVAREVLCRVFDDGADAGLEEWLAFYAKGGWWWWGRGLGAFIRTRMDRMVADGSALRLANERIAQLYAVNAELWKEKRDSGEPSNVILTERRTMSALYALTDWRNYWETEHADDLVLTGKQADELCTMLGIPFDNEVKKIPAVGPSSGALERAAQVCDKYARDWYDRNDSYTADQHREAFAAIELARRIRALPVSGA